MYMIILWTVLGCYKFCRISVKHANRRGKQKYGLTHALGTNSVQIHSLSDMGIVAGPSATSIGWTLTANLQNIKPLV